MAMAGSLTLSQEIQDYSGDSFVAIRSGTVSNVEQAREVRATSTTLAGFLFAARTTGSNNGWQKLSTAVAMLRFRHGTQGLSSDV